MSHTTTFSDHDSNEWVVIHDGFAPAGKVRVRGPNGTFSIPAEVMIGFAVECVRAAKIAKIEQAEGPELLGLETP